MPVPEFVVQLRDPIGNPPLPLSGVIAMVLDEHDRALLVRRSDTADWSTAHRGGKRPSRCAASYLLAEHW